MTDSDRGAVPVERLPPALERLSTALADPAAGTAAMASRPGRGVRGAAVLALFGGLDSQRWPQTAEELTITLIERSHTMRSHPGQISFPGGAIDAADSDVVHTALREADEEIGLAADSVAVVGTMPPAYVARSGFDVFTVVGWWQHRHQIAAGDPAEVHDVVTVPLATICDPANRVTSLHPSGYRGPAFVVGELFVWGLTAHLLDALIELAGWATPWDRGREQPVPTRFMIDRASQRRG